MKPRLALCSFAFALAAAVGLAQNGGTQFTSEFDVGDCAWRTQGENTYFVLVPGSKLVLEAEEDGEIERVEITVLRETEKLFVPGMGWVTTRVVQEVETVDDELVEVSRNFFALCGGAEGTNDLFYFGEDVDIFHEDGSVTHDGAWRAGQPDGDGLAEPGILVPGRFLLGARYYQELADGIALDRGENVAMGLEVTTEAGTFHDCVQVKETSPLEPGSQSVKVYCPGVGLVIDNDAELVEYVIKD